MPVVNPGGGGGAGLVTKRATMATTGDGTTNASGPLDWIQRNPIVFPVTPTRFRLRFANRSSYSSAQGTDTVTVTSAWIGTPLMIDTAAGWNARYASAPTQIVDSMVLSSAVDNVSPWVDAAALGLKAGVPYGLSIGLSANSSATWFACPNFGYSLTGTGIYSQAGALAVTGSTPELLGQLDIRVEYEAQVAPGTPLVLVIGTSIESGYLGSGGKADACASWPAIAALRNGWPVINLGAGSTALISGSNPGWVSSTAWMWQRADLATTPPDVAIIGGATNDLWNASTVANIQSAYATVIDYIRTLGVGGVWLNSVIAYNSTYESNRLSLNSWLREMPYDASGCIDVAKALYLPGTSGPQQNDPDYVTTVPHPERSGYQRMAAVVPSFAGAAA